MTASIFSVYFPNISDEVVEAQYKCVMRFIPKGWTFTQYRHNPNGDVPHASAMHQCLELSSDDVVMFLDIDCIPLHDRAFPLLYECVQNDRWDPKEKWQGLAGAIQRANHIQNNRHLYVGPFCMAFSRNYYNRLGCPPFAETARGDVGEELTYRWTEQSGFRVTAGATAHKYSSNIHFLWPTSCEQPAWELFGGRAFGLGTTYGAVGVHPHLFYHAFNARDEQTKSRFLLRCNQILKEKEEPKCALSASAS